jgi:Kdo2-lipid IVA lauroyltransferase/acyltransferase
MISFLFLRLMIILVGLMPFRVMYWFSDFVYLILYHVIGYRRKVVFANLSKSFPEKSTVEIKELEKKFYHHLCDISLESIKGFSMSPKEIIRRHKILNPELANHFFDRKLSAISVPGHYNNWEWGSLSPGLQLKYPIVGFYKPMSNKRVDAFAKRHRAKFNTKLASIKETAVTFDELSGTLYAYIMASDQSPTNLNACYWIDFLNQDTAWLHGPEKYARKYNWPVIYVDIRKVKRGFYELELVTLTEDPASLPEGEITRLYVQYLEKSILTEPAYWLWSHRRWKHSRS